MMDENGSLTIELAIVVMIILLIIGVVLTTFENTTDKVITSQESEHLESIITEVVDNLINNPGVPDNWYELEKGTSGLAIINEEGQVIPNSISWEKFVVLSKNYKKLVTEKLFSSKIKTSMELTPQKSSISSVKIGPDFDGDDVFSVNRLVRCDFYKKYVIKDFQNEGKCNHNHDQSKNSCNYFKIFKGNLRKSNYYLILDDDEKYDLKYIIDTTRIVKARDWQTSISSVIPLNDEIKFYDDTSAVVFIHLDKPKAKAVLISVPKTFDRNNLKYDYFRTNECQLTVKATY